MCLRTSPVLESARTERTGQWREKTWSNTTAKTFGEVRRNQREFWHTVPIIFPIPHRPTKLLIEPAACKSLKINKVGSRALASLLITKRGICGNRAGKRAAVEWTRATSLRFSLGERAKKSQPIRVGTLSIGGSLKYETTSASTQKSSTTF